jgi:hypothetical protein
MLRHRKGLHSLNSAAVYAVLNNRELPPKEKSQKTPKNMDTENRWRKFMDMFSVSFFKDSTERVHCMQNE